MRIKNGLSIIFVFLGLLFSATLLASDSGITRQVLHNLAANHSLSGTKIQVITSDGIVKLSGTVKTETQATTATEVAQSTMGVKDVDASSLNVLGGTSPIADAYITAKVKGAFLQQKLFKNKDIAAMSIKVETNDGVVSLSGTADNQKQIDNAIKIAKSVSGVKEVNSIVQIANNSSSPAQY